MADLTLDQVYDRLLERTHALCEGIIASGVSPPLNTDGIRCTTLGMKHFFVIFEWQCGALCLVKVWITAEEYHYRCFNMNEAYLDPEYAQECTDGVKFNTAEEVIEWLKRKGVNKRPDDI